MVMNVHKHKHYCMKESHVCVLERQSMASFAVHAWHEHEPLPCYVAMSFSLK